MILLLLLLGAGVLQVIIPALIFIAFLALIIWVFKEGLWLLGIILLLLLL